MPVKIASLLALGREQEAIKLAGDGSIPPPVEVELAEVFLQGKLPDEALKCLNLAAPGWKRIPVHFYYVKGRALQAKGQNSEAIHSFQQALAEDPKSTGAHGALSEIEMNRSTGTRRSNLRERLRKFTEKLLRVQSNSCQKR